jgi:hypothetical protein
MELSHWLGLPITRWAKEMGKNMADETGEELPEDFDEMMENGPQEEGDEG